MFGSISHMQKNFLGVPRPVSPATARFPLKLFCYAKK